MVPIALAAQAASSTRSAKGREMNLVKRSMLALTAVVLAACSQTAHDGKRFIGVWESTGDPLRTVEVAPNGDNFLVTILNA
jgi:hypothetical protein